MQIFHSRRRASQSVPAVRLDWDLNLQQSSQSEQTLLKLSLCWAGSYKKLCSLQSISLLMSFTIWKNGYEKFG